MAAPRISIDVKGLDELRDTLTDLAPREVRNILRNTVHGLAGKVRDRLRARVVKRSGALAKSIKAVRRRGTPNAPVSEVRGGGGAPYMYFVEFGTTKMPAQPFITPTVEEFRAGLTEEYRTEFGKKLEKALAKRSRAR